MRPRYERLRSTVVPLLADDVDTDQIIPARFLKTTDKANLARALFHDRRGPGFPLDRPEHRGAQVLLAGRNFGCGSSREHAPWALVAGGFRAVVARSFGDIFTTNALKNGLLPVALDDAAHARLAAAVAADPAVEIDIDLATRTLGLPGGTRAEFPVDPFAQHCLLEGLDELEYLLRFEREIAAHEQQRS